jgi:glycosyltransferase involved in cell wall biosynthesis
MLKSVMLVNAVHKPYDTRIFHKEALSLIQAGWHVIIIVPHTHSETVLGVEVVSVPLPKKGWEQLIKCPWYIFREALKQPKDAVYHLHDSELLIIGLLLRITGRTVIYDAHEDTPLQISYQHWLPGWAKFFYRWFYFMLEKVCGWSFKAIIVAEPVIAKYFPVRKTFLVRNFPVADVFKQTLNKTYSDRDTDMVYIGLLSRVRGLKEMLEGHQKACKSVKVNFLLGGKFAPKNLKEELFDSYSATYVGWVNYERLVNILFNAKIGIIIPHPIERYRTNYPVKLFEYMAAGIPVIASAEGESASFVREAQCGILVNPLDTNQVADAIIWLLNNPIDAEKMGNNGREIIFRKYCWEMERESLLKVYSNVSGLQQ